MPGGRRPFAHVRTAAPMVAAAVVIVCAAPACAAGGVPAATPSPAPAPAPASVGAQDDLYTVYCLAPEHRAQTIAAAVRLGVAATAAGEPGVLAAGPGGAGPTLSLTRWAADRPAAFRRVCAAVLAAAAVAPNAPGTTDAGAGPDSDGIVHNTVLALIGVAATLLGAAVERVAGRSREWRVSLAAACSAYQLQAGTFLDRWSDSRDADFGDARAAHTALSTLLRTAPGPAARRAVAAELAGRLPLGQRPESTSDAGVTGVQQLSRQERFAIAGRRLGTVNEAATEVLALGLERSGPSWQARRVTRSAIALARRALHAGGDTP